MESELDIVIVVVVAVLLRALLGLSRGESAVDWETRGSSKRMRSAC
jgi:hypothetical protein